MGDISVIYLAGLLLLTTDIFMTQIIHGTYIIPGPMRIKIPLKYIANHLDEDDFEFDERNKIQKDLALRMLEEPKVKNIIKKYKTTPEEIRE